VNFIDSEGIKDSYGYFELMKLEVLMTIQLQRNWNLYFKILNDKINDFVKVLIDKKLFRLDYKA